MVKITSRRFFLFDAVIKIEERNVRYVRTFAGEISLRTTPATIASVVARDDGATIR